MQPMHIVIAQPLAVSEKLIASLSSDFKDRGWTLTTYDTLPKDQADLGERIAGADMAIIANYPLREEALEKAAQLKYVCVAFTGVDHMDIGYCKERGIAVSNCAGYSTTAVAELTFGLILTLYRKITEADAATRSGKGSAGLMGLELSGKTVGIIGTGAIGRRVAEIAKAFGANVIGWNRSHKADIHYVDLDTLMKTADIITVHLPLTPGTKHLVSREKLSLMKSTAILINTARGPVVDEAALADFLKKGKIAGAGIDVYDTEPPLPPDHPLLSTPHTVLTPHEGFFTKEAMEKRAVLVFRNLRSWAEGKQENVIC